jgi:hypothetical protein
MLSVDLYRDILPDWTRLRTLSEAEIEAGADLLVALTQLGDLTAQSQDFQDLKETWIELLCGYDQVARAALSAHIDASYQRVHRLFEHPHAFGILLASACSRLRSPVTQFHILCLFIVTIFCSGPDERQIELGYRIGKKFNMPEDRIEDLFARMWSTFHAARADAGGTEFPREYVAGTRWQRQKTNFHATANPFEMPRR